LSDAITGHASLTVAGRYLLGPADELWGTRSRQALVAFKVSKLSPIPSTTDDGSMAKKRLDLAPRNDPLGLAQRAWTNLSLIERAYDARNEGHVVTQLVQTLLALIVFPKAKEFFDHVSPKLLDDLEESGWPRPKQIIGTTDTLGCLLKHMRNAVCHGHLKFYGDDPKDGANSRKLHEITIEFSDRKNKSPFDWRVTIEGQDLKRFLWHIFDYLNDGAPGPL
jgi:hypothetical protein